MTISSTQATSFAQAWVAVWNSHDLDRILSHYADHVEMTSPLAASLGLGERGTVKGKEALRAYWRRGLDANPGLRFELVEVCAGVSTVGIVYRNHKSQLVVETVVLDENGVVIKAEAMYSIPNSGKIALDVTILAGIKAFPPFSVQIPSFGGCTHRVNPRFHRTTYRTPEGRTVIKGIAGSVDVWAPLSFLELATKEPERLGTEIAIILA
ncbi:hypothetical protein M427DRAFT_70836 [Gonapodya prolifera JEL478]|uniref:SnoaL-like domain-containing protein n=1 Tax=Gonapodya prolifera (strain JEL478) TaxID=1344416 RepID=A0A139ABP7_GONPJ|nr:hypothetical protein M427DRAFT_70836 [Gonapodya prolifera JEL478]|eukprot:KXS14148.1 hypothetical protein M427DRAFT_70836 [Gonapodya prolifera JEL478]